MVTAALFTLWAVCVQIRGDVESEELPMSLSHWLALWTALGWVLMPESICQRTHRCGESTS